MAFQTVFKRQELKYLLTPQQKEAVRTAMEPYMKSDEYGKTTIRNLYYDTDTYLLARRSIEKPVYKEKLRVRSYCRATADSVVFAELKKKYQRTVYKRRISLPEAEAMDWLAGKIPCPKHTQIAQEIEYFLNVYQTLHPVTFLSYEREAYYAKDNINFRVTFDESVLGRQEDLSLESDVYGTDILPRGKVLMEIKCSDGMPLWMTDVLSKEHIYGASFSKYGTVYRAMIFPQLYTNFYHTEGIVHDSAMV